jgi:hypothetical protein
MSAFEIKAVIKKPFNSNLVNDGLIVSQRDDSAVIKLATKEDMESAISAREELVQGLKDKGLEVKKTVIHLSTKERE